MASLVAHGTKTNNCLKMG